MAFLGWLLASTAAVFGFLAACTLRLSLPEPPGERLAVCLQESFAQGLRPMALRPEQEVFRDIRPTDAGYSCRYGFKNFNGDKLTLEAELDGEAVAASAREFGFRKEDFDRIDAWYQQAQKDTIARAKELFFSGKVTAKSQEELEGKMRDIKARNQRVQKELDETLAALGAEYKSRRVELYRSTGFHFQSEHVVEADMPELARRNAARVRSVAQAFSRIASERGYGSEELVGAVTAMAQTALRYEFPGDYIGGKYVAGVLPPPKALAEGQGDCASKSALIASILESWPNLKLVGLEIPEHYLLAIHRLPRRGDVFIEHEGLPYIMIESAGPAWLSPGQVGDTTMSYLESGKQFRIQPM